MTLPTIEQVAAKVHEAWIEAAFQGVTSAYQKPAKN